MRKSIELLFFVVVMLGRLLVRWGEVACLVKYMFGLGAVYIPRLGNARHEDVFGNETRVGVPKLVPVW